MRLTVAVWIGIAVAMMAPRVADAYPQFQLVLEEKCSSCHFASAGGGLINAYGRDAAGSAISPGGDGRFLHGAWDPPEWLALGADVRLAAFAKRLRGDNGGNVFPMQSDVYARAIKGGFAVSITAGLRGAAGDVEPTYVERLWSREHYVSYETSDLLVRAGRFYPVFGLRLHDHTAYVRRHLGMYLNEEPYSVGISHFGEATETHVTAFVKQPIPVLGAGYQPSGMTGLVERTVSEKIVAGGQARMAVSDNEMRLLAGGIVKWKLAEKTLLLGELDLQRQSFRGSGPARMQAVGYVGVSHWLRDGLMLTPAVQLWDPDVMLERSHRAAIEANLQYFVRAHFELHLLMRSQITGAVDEPGFLALLQGHYYL